MLRWRLVEHQCEKVQPDDYRESLQLQPSVSPQVYLASEYKVLKILTSLFCHHWDITEELYYKAIAATSNMWLLPMQIQALGQELPW